MKPSELHADADDELRDALEHYDRQRDGLAGEFRREFEAALARACDNPLAYAAEDDSGARHAALHRFPYSLVYVDFEDRVWVAAVMHHSRRPGYWKRRRPG